MPTAKLSKPHKQAILLAILIQHLNNDLNIIINWGKLNRVDFNANKTQSCLLTHKRVDGLDFRTWVAGVDVPRSNGLDMLGMQVQSNLHWDKHIFEIAKKAAQSIGLLKRCKKYFTPLDLRNIYTSYIRPKMEYNAHIWAGASRSSLEYLDRIQERAKRLIGDDEVSSSLSPLGHRRDVGCLTLLYRYFHGECASEIRDLMPPLRTFNRQTRFSRSAHRFHVNSMAQRTSHYQNGSFFSRTTRIWNTLPASVFPNEFNVARFKQNVHRFLTLFPIPLLTSKPPGLQLAKEERSLSPV